MKTLLIAICLVSMSCINQSNNNSIPATIVAGIDISTYQDKINWEALKEEELSFLFIKATSGNKHVDEQFLLHWDNARANDYKIGAYHFYYSTHSPEKQARHFIHEVLPHSLQKDLPPVLDIEKGGIQHDITSEQIKNDLKTWLELVEEAFHKTPIIYTSVSCAKKYLNDQYFSKYPLWIAEYDVLTPKIPYAWEKRGWLFWQKSSHVELKGISGRVDYSLFNGTKKELEQL